MDLPTLSYLTFDEIGRGVGASQVVPYVERFAGRGLDVVLHSFEHGPPSPTTHRRLAEAGVDWRPRPFGRLGGRGAARRVATGARLVRGSALTHARSDLPAASVMLAGAHPWLWDVRSLWTDQRIALGMIRPGSTGERVGRAIEGAAARRSGAISVLSGAGGRTLAERHGVGVASKTVVVSTCVDLQRFPLAPMPPADPVVLLLSGTFNALYDRALTFRLIDAVAEIRPVAVHLVRPAPSAWDPDVVARGGMIAASLLEEMPDRVGAAHAGLVMLAGGSSAATVGATPTKVAEFLATGRPVVTTPGVGDLDALLVDHSCGVVVGAATPDAVADAAEELCALLDDPELPARCRRLAEDHFDLERGVDDLLDAYRRMVSGAG